MKIKFVLSIDENNTFVKGKSEEIKIDIASFQSAVGARHIAQKRIFSMLLRWFSAGAAELLHCEVVDEAETA
jgi:hypothetical protein